MTKKSIEFKKVKKQYFFAKFKILYFKQDRA